jgi:hypothetical protein
MRYIALRLSENVAFIGKPGLFSEATQIAVLVQFQSTGHEVSTVTR